MIGTCSGGVRELSSDPLTPPSQTPDSVRFCCGCGEFLSVICPFATVCCVPFNSPRLHHSCLSEVLTGAFVMTCPSVPAACRSTSVAQFTATSAGFDSAKVLTDSATAAKRSLRARPYTFNVIPGVTCRASSIASFTVGCPAFQDERCIRHAQTVEIEPPPDGLLGHASHRRHTIASLRSPAPL
jgi:hypothetical protein